MHKCCQTRGFNPCGKSKYKKNKGLKTLVLGRHSREGEYDPLRMHSTVIVIILVVEVEFEGRLNHTSVAGIQLAPRPRFRMVG